AQFSCIRRSERSVARPHRERRRTGQESKRESALQPQRLEDAPSPVALAGIETRLPPVLFRRYWLGTKDGAATKKAVHPSGRGYHQPFGLQGLSRGLRRKLGVRFNLDQHAR